MQLRWSVGMSYYRSGGGLHERPHHEGTRGAEGLEVDIRERLAEGRIVDGSDIGPENVSLVRGQGCCAVLAHPMVSARMISMIVPRTPALPIAPTMAWLRESVVLDSDKRRNIRYGIGGVARLLGDGHGAVEAAYMDERWRRAAWWRSTLTNGPHGCKEGEDECKAARPSGEVGEPSKGELGGVELTLPSNGKTDDGGEGKGDVEDDTRRLHPRESAGEVRAVNAAEDEDAAVKTEGLRGGGGEVLVVDRHGGEEDACASPGEGRDGGDVAEERVVLESSARCRVG